MLNLLAIETSTHNCSVAFSYANKRCLREESQPQSHARVLLDMLDDAARELAVDFSKIDGVLVDTGPGSFTGLRIGMSVAQGIAYAHNLPMCGVSSLAALAMQCRSDNVLAILDARMHEVYYALYTKNSGQYQQQGEPIVAPAKDCQIWLQSIAAHAFPKIDVIGNGVSAYSEIKQALMAMKNQFVLVNDVAIPNAYGLLDAFQGCYVTQAQQQEALHLATDLTAQYVRNQVTS